MTERLLQYIWQFSYFNVYDLHTEEQQPLQIIHPGSFNTNQGPDFLNAKIKTGSTTWAGHVEIHINSSDWELHGHGTDSNYQNVILHVVWKHDRELGLPFPTLELHNRVSSVLLQRYGEFMRSDHFIPCQQHIHKVPEIILQSWKERLLAERLKDRSILIARVLMKTNSHWEEICWWQLARNFGIPQNADAFEAIARSLPLKIIARHKNQLQQVESLLFGQAGLLNKSFKEAYPSMLRREYIFLTEKYGLEPIKVPIHFLRMRPANFPTVRLAQLAALLHSSHHLFSKIKETTSIEAMQKLFNITANDYWHYHYNFEEETSYREKKLGPQMIRNILVNAIVPLLFAYGDINSFEEMKDRSIAFTESLPPEKNKITAGFEALGIINKNAFDSQALLQLKKEYCNNKKCLQCAIGSKIIKGLV
ncbi:MAG: DUF2851 family protein [Ferruginibacter sp.]